MQTQQSTKIGNREITSVQLDVITAYKLLAKIGKVMIPAALAARGVTGKSDSTELMPAITQLFDALSPELAESLMLESLQATSVVMPDANGKLLKIDLTGASMIKAAFAGDLKAMLLTMKFALEVNYASFFVASDVAETETPTQSL